MGTVAPHLLKVGDLEGANFFSEAAELAQVSVCNSFLGISVIFTIICVSYFPVDFSIVT